jgi:hypothetical protein
VVRLLCLNQSDPAYPSVKDNALYHYSTVSQDMDHTQPHHHAKSADSFGEERTKNLKPRHCLGRESLLNIALIVSL